MTTGLHPSGTGVSNGVACASDLVGLAPPVADVLEIGPGLCVAQAATAKQAKAAVRPSVAPVVTGR
jgi:hypothetical protein